MKPLILCFLAVTSFVGLNSCKKDAVNGKISINFINKTGAKIQNATADDIQVGSITEDGQTGFIRFEKFGTDTGMPDCNLIGLFNNDTLKSTSSFYWCATQKSQLKPGQYNIEIKLYTRGVNKYFALNFR